jgi:hypothetical protein
VPRFGPPEALARLCVDGAHADSVELKTLLATAAGWAAEALTGRPSPTWSERRTYLIDTDALDLLRAGVEIRLRRRARGRYDLAVSTQRSGTARERNTPRAVRTELDVVPGAVWQYLEIRRDVEAGAAAHVIGGGLDPGELLSPPQRSWALRGGHDIVDDARLKELAVHGPLVVHRVKVSAQVGLRRADLEHFRFPSGRELVELSTHCGPQEVTTTAAAFEQLLDDREIAVARWYRTKTSLWHDEFGP